VNEGIDMKTRCPYCSSENVLPFEEEGRPEDGNQTFITILLAAMAVLAAYFLFLMISYINYPVMTIIVILAVSFVLRRQDKKKRKRKKIQADKNFICLDCNSQFVSSVESH